MLAGGGGGPGGLCCATFLAAAVLECRPGRAVTKLAGLRPAAPRRAAAAAHQSAAGWAGELNAVSGARQYSSAAAAAGTGARLAARPAHHRSNIQLAR